MTHEETKELMDDILQVRERNKDLTIVIVEHEMGVIERITDRCVVLNFGRKIAEGPYRAGRRRPRRCRKPIWGWLMSGRLDIEDVFTAYDKADVLEGVSLTIEPGRITCLLGSNGSGKTTLIRSILGLTPPRAGRITFDGTDITALPTHKVIAAGIACIPEGRKVFPKFTVEENLRARRLPGNLGRGHARAHGRDLCACFRGWPSAATQLAGTMSGGEQAMVSIGRGLMRAPKLLLIDEPSLGLSPLLVQGEFQHHPPDQRARHHGVPGRAERAPDAGDRALRLCAVERPRGRGGHTLRAGRPPRGARSLFFLGNRQPMA